MRGSQSSRLIFQRSKIKLAEWNSQGSRTVNEHLQTIQKLCQPRAAGANRRLLLARLKSVYTEPLLPLPRLSFDYPQVIALEDAGVPAYYSSFLITAEDADELAALVESSFDFVVEKPFNDHSVKRYSNAQKDEQLIYFISCSEFNAATVRMVTNSVDFLGVVLDSRWAVPPPWVVFEGYKAAWWGGNMQGAQGYYNGCYFLPFFTRLSGSEKQEYYARFHATPEWIECLALMYGDG